MTRCTEFGFALGRTLAVKQAADWGKVIGGAGKAFTAAKSLLPGAAAAAKPVAGAADNVAAAIARPAAAGVKKVLPPPQATIPGTAGSRVFGDTSGLLADNAKAIAANPHYQAPGAGPIRMAPPRAAGAPAAPAPRPPLPAPQRGAGALAPQPKVTISPAEAAAGRSKVTVSPAEAAAGRSKVTVSPAEAAAGQPAIKISPEDVAAMSQRWGDASSGGRAQMLGYNAQGRGALAPPSMPSEFSRLSPAQQQQVLRSFRGQ